MELSNEEIKEILAIIADSGWDDVRLTVGEVTLAVSKNGAAPLGGPPAAPPPAIAAAASPPAALAAAPTPSPGQAAPAAAAPAPVAAAPGEQLVNSPSVGIFWRAPAPGAAPFVEVGDQVEPGQTVCIVEVMKLMQHVAAEVAGTVVAIHQENSESVEYGSPLLTIAAAAEAA
jgi:acetyl-CoA carboxylase biotin carboxyl carrier protein